MKLLLRREPPQKDCTLGLLLIPEISFSLVTIELPWIASPTCKGGLKGKSCVPVGTYQLVRHDSPKHPRTWALVNYDLDVVHFEGDDHDPDEDRAACLIHIANYARELEGCIGVGTRTAIVDGTYLVADSNKAMRLLQAAVPWDDSHTLTVSQ